MGGPRVGVIGGGQLARMLAEAATPLGIHVVVLAAPSDEGAAEVVPDVLVGEPDDPEALRRLADAVEVITIDHENVDHATLAALEAAGVAVRPSVGTLAYSDKAHQRTEFAAADLPVPPFVVLAADDPHRGGSAARFAAEHPAGVVLKAARGGYDGRAVWMPDPSRPEELAELVAELSGQTLVLEAMLALEVELAVLVARRPSGEVATWPVFETVQVDGMCDEVIHPALVDHDVAREARRLAAQVAEVTGAVGVLAVELFVTDGRVIVNEIAPRVHNSGHLTIEGSATSQFEQHLRAVLDWPLGPTDMTAPVAVMANVVGGRSGDPRDRQAAALGAVPAAHVHLYGKASRPRRKVGHVTVLGAQRAEVRRLAAVAAELLGGEPPIGSDHDD